MNTDEDLLNQITAHLRSESAPEMPAALTTRCTAKPRGWFRYAVGASALAASIVGFLIWRSHASQSVEPRAPTVVQQPREDTQESDVVVRAVDLTEPLARLEANLDSVDAEIAELRSKAALLDAQRMADELLVQY
ncbi:MAG: hypothetical protein WD049_02895 [Candidatus Paceibacterota bacterium]